MAKKIAGKKISFNNRDSSSDANPSYSENESSSSTKPTADKSSGGKCFSVFILITIICITVAISFGFKQVIDEKTVEFNLEIKKLQDKIDSLSKSQSDMEPLENVIKDFPEVTRSLTSVTQRQIVEADKVHALSTTVASLKRLVSKVTERMEYVEKNNDVIQNELNKLDDVTTKFLPRVNTSLDELNGLSASLQVDIIELQKQTKNADIVVTDTKSRLEKVEKTMEPLVSSMEDFRTKSMTLEGTAEELMENIRQLTKSYTNQEKKVTLVENKYTALSVSVEKAKAHSKHVEDALSKRFVGDEKKQQEFEEDLSKKMVLLEKVTEENLSEIQRNVANTKSLSENTLKELNEIKQTTLGDFSLSVNRIGREYEHVQLSIQKLTTKLSDLEATVASLQKDNGESQIDEFSNALKQIKKEVYAVVTQARRLEDASNQSVEKLANQVSLLSDKLEETQDQASKLNDEMKVVVASLNSINKATNEPKKP